MATIKAKEKAATTRRATKKTIDDMYMGAEPVFNPKETPKDPAEYDRAWSKAAVWYNYYYNPKDYVPYVIKYGTEVLKWSKQDVAAVKTLKDWEISLGSTMSIGVGKATVIWARGFEYTAKWKKRIKENMELLVKAGYERQLEVGEVKAEKQVAPVISPIERMRNKMMDTIYADFDDHIVEGWIEGDYKRTLDVYGLMKKHAIKGAAVNMFAERVQLYLDEFLDAYNKTCEQAVEAYSHVKRTDLKKAINQLESILSDVESIKLSAKATRLPRAKKPKTSDKQVEKLQYMKESMDFKLTSINPIMIPGKLRLYVFNTKTKKLIEYTCDSTKGFEVKGTTLQNFDKQSRCVTLRKPEDVLPLVLTKTPKQIDNIWKGLTTKTSEPNGRINKDCILLRAMEI